MKKTFHILSAILSLALALLGVCLIVFRDQPEQEARTMYMFIGFVQTAMGLIAFLIGALLPEKAVKMSDRAKKIMRVIVVLSMLGGKGSGGAAYNTLNGDVTLQRFWEPAWPVAWLMLEGMLLWFYPASGLLGVLVAVSVTLLFGLIASAFGWSVMYRKETGTLKWYNVLGPTLFILLLFGLVFLITFITQVRRGSELSEKVADARTRIERALEDYEEGSYDEAAADMSRMTIEDVIGMLKNDIGGDIYYCWVPGDGDAMSLTAWNDADDNVYVYQFTKDGDTYILNNGFISSSLTKDDVEGKEQGVVPAG